MYGISESDVKDQADIGNVGAGEVFENGYKVQQLVVVRVRKPAADRNSVLGVEYVGGRRVVDDDGVFQISSNLRKVLDIVSLVVVAALSE